MLMQAGVYEAADGSPVLGALSDMGRDVCKLPVPQRKLTAKTTAHGGKSAKGNQLKESHFEKSSRIFIMKH